MKIDRIIKTAALSTALNALVAAVHLYIGIQSPSWWFVTLGIYYAILGISRLTVILMGEKTADKIVSTYTGISLTVTALPLFGIVILCSVREVGHKYHEILMIAMAAYAFTKVTLGIINLVRVRRDGRAYRRALRNISLADALVSIASLQRSMLLSFGEMTSHDITLFNILTGTGVSILIFLLGLNLILSRRGAK